MAHGVEVRSPFLDRTVVELAADMSIAMKLRIRPGGIETKRVLREAVADLVPAEVLARPKQGFGTPVGPWLRGPCRHLLDGLVESVEGLVPSDPLRAAVRDHLDGRADHRRRIWSALVLGRWRVGRWGPG